MLTKKQLEAAARELCRLRGQDPAEVVHLHHSDGRAGYSVALRWMGTLPEVTRQAEVEEAIKFARDMPD
jgi:hypothetical protein